MVLFKYFNKKIFSLVVAWALLSPTNVFADTMFEGYYKILSGGVHVGFVVQRFEYDKATKTFTSVYYIKTNKFAGNITEGLKAKSNEKFEPISYEYTSTAGGNVKTINGSFKGSKMTLVISNGKVSNTIEKNLPKGTFLSTFLAYMMLSRGISQGKKFTYSAIAEEDGEVFSGQAYIEKPVTENGLSGFRVLNEFKGSKFISVMTPKAEVISTKSPLQHIATELVPRPPMATQGFQLDTKSMRILFGRIPGGKDNPLSKAAVVPSTLPSKKGATVSKGGKGAADKKDGK